MLLLRYIWAFPNTLIGLLFVPFVIMTRGHMQTVDGVVELHGRLIATILRRCVPIPGGAAAITFGHVVLGRDSAALASTRAHERIHVGQCEVWGPAFIPAYLLAGLWALITGAGAYHGNYFERQASCVRERREARAAAGPTSAGRNCVYGLLPCVKRVDRPRGPLRSGAVVYPASPVEPVAPGHDGQSRHQGPIVVPRRQRATQFLGLA
jgi:hypothetical protein